MAEFSQTQPLCLGVLASHTGTNFQGILNRCLSGELRAKVGVVISNNSQSGVIERAKQAGLPFAHLSGVTHPDPEDLDRATTEILCQQGVDLVVLAGYMKKLGPRLVATFSDRILNIHPSLLPAFGGQGMYGLHVHQAVIDSFVHFSGATVHLVNEEYDQGRILLQETVRVLPDDTAQTLADRVLQLEHRLFPAAIRLFAKGLVSD